jgi:DNA (cytosine-5)-methyltransferase 1
MDNVNLAKGLPELPFGEDLTSVAVTKDPTFVDFFAGSGGLSLGLLQAGWQGLFAVERDEMAFATLRANLVDGQDCKQFLWPGVIPLKPMTIASALRLLGRPEVRAQLHDKVDLLAGGPPCQGFSLAGQRNHDDPRNKLFRSYIRGVGLLRPRMIAIENVQGVAVKHGSRKMPFLRKIQRALRKLGYSSYAGLHRAADFGVPQERPRYFIVGVDTARFPACTDAALKEFTDRFVVSARRKLLDNKKLIGALPVTVRDAISDLETRGAELEPADVPRRLQVKYARPETLTAYQAAMKAPDGRSMDSMRLARHSQAVEQKWRTLIAYCITNKRRGVLLNDREREVLKSKKHTVVVLDPKRPAHTLTSLPDDLLHYREPRILTVREYARLQSFPDWFVFRGKYTTGGERRVKECPRYTQVGNAVAPLVAEGLGLALMEIWRALHATDATTHAQPTEAALMAA